MSVFELPKATLIPNCIHHPPVEDGRLLPKLVKNSMIASRMTTSIPIEKTLSIYRIFRSPDADEPFFFHLFNLSRGHRTTSDRGVVFLPFVNRLFYNAIFTGNFGDRFSSCDELKDHDLSFLMNSPYYLNDLFGCTIVSSIFRTG